MGRSIFLCLFCGSNPEIGNHDFCKMALEQMKLDMRHEEAWRVMQKAESGYYGSPPSRSVSDPSNWKPRAMQLRDAGLEWTEVAKALNEEGFKSKQGKPLDRGLILNNLYQHKLKNKVSDES